MIKSQMWQLDDIHAAGYEAFIFSEGQSAWRVELWKGKINVYHAKAHSERKAIRKGWRYVLKRIQRYLEPATKVMEAKR